MVASLLRAEGPWFKSQPRRCRVTVLGKLFTPIYIYVHQAAKLVAFLLRVAACGDNCKPGGKWWQSTAGFMTHVTCRLTAKNRNQLRNPTLGNRVWATFAFLSALRMRSTVAFKLRIRCEFCFKPVQSDSLKSACIIPLRSVSQFLRVLWDGGVHAEPTCRCSGNCDVRIQRQRSLTAFVFVF